MKQKISVVISAYNEEKKIEDCLNSVSWADEIVVINSGSTDQTVAVAKKYTKNIFDRSNNPMLNVNKNFGFSKAGGDWILSVDADERITPQLRKEIIAVINSDDKVNGYWIPRKNIIFGMWVQSDFWWPDYQLRLFRKGKGKFAQAHVHEYITVEGETRKLTEPMLHENYSTVTQYITKMDKIYTESEVENMQKNGRSVLWHDAIRFPVQDFLKTFFLQKGYKYGLHGLVLSLLQAFYMEVVFAKMWERQGFPQENNQTFLQDVYKETKRAGHEFLYWFFSAFIDTTKNPIKKVTYKIARRRIRNKIPR